MDSRRGEPHSGRHALVAVGLCGLVAAPVVLHVPSAQWGEVTAALGVLCGLLLVATSLTTVAMLGRGRPSYGGNARLAWITTAAVLLGSQAVIGAEMLIAPDAAAAGFAATRLAVALLTLGLVSLGALGVACPRPWLTGAAVVTLAALLRLTVSAEALFPPLTAAGTVALSLLTVVVHAVIGVVISHAFRLRGTVALRVWATMTLFGVAAWARTPGFEHPLTAALLNGAMAAVMVLWAASALERLGATVLAQQRRAMALEGDLLELSSSGRTHAECMHEVRSTIAGIRAADELSALPQLDEQTRSRLRSTVSTELSRLERLVSREPTPSPPAAPLTVDLDTTLRTLSETHRARGHDVEWNSSGTALRADGDDVSVAVNILLENSARHAQGSHSRIDVTEREETVEIVVSDDGPGIADEIRDHIFDWGVSSDPGRGDGIGLAMAQRLVCEHGGSLDLLDAPRPGAAFMIRLPAARVSEEDL